MALWQLLIMSLAPVAVYLNSGWNALVIYSLGAVTALAVAQSYYLLVYYKPK